MEVAQIIALGENEKIEFKESFSKEVVISLVSFANFHGGTVYVGITNNGKVKGVSINQETVQQYINEMRNSTQPVIVPEVSIEEVAGGKKILIISISEYPIKPVSYKGRYYIRRKNSNHVMSVDEVINSRLQSMNTSWDCYHDPYHGMKDISFEKVTEFINRINAIRGKKIEDDPKTILRKFELIREEKLTLGCFLMFMKDPSIVSTIELGRFQTDTIIKDALTLRTDLFSEVDQVLEFITKHINKRYVFTGSVMREERWDYPLEALRELVVNAIVHRDYSSPVDTVIKIYDNRIEFFNSGGLQGDISVDEIINGKLSSKPRNKLIAAMFKDAGIIEKYGSGIKRVVEEFRKYGLPDPVFKVSPNDFHVTVFTFPENETVNETVNETINETVKLSKIQKEIIKEIKNNEEITYEELAEKLKKGRATIHRHIQDLIKKGTIKRVGSAKSGYWKINE